MAGDKIVSIKDCQHQIISSVEDLKGKLSIDIKEDAKGEWVLDYKKNASIKKT